MTEPVKGDKPKPILDIDVVKGTFDGIMSHIEIKDYPMSHTEIVAHYVKKSDEAHALELKNHVLKFSIWAYDNNNIHLVDEETDTWADDDGYLFTFDEAYSQFLNETK